MIEDIQVKISQIINELIRHGNKDTVEGKKYYSNR